MPSTFAFCAVSAAATPAPPRCDPRDAARTERNAARGERDDATDERDEARRERDDARRERDQAKRLECSYQRQISRLQDVHAREHARMARGAQVVAITTRVKMEQAEHAQAEQLRDAEKRATASENGRLTLLKHASVEHADMFGPKVLDELRAGDEYEYRRGRLQKTNAHKMRTAKLSKYLKHHFGVVGAMREITRRATKSLTTIKMLDRSPRYQRGARSFVMTSRFSSLR